MTNQSKLSPRAIAFRQAIVAFIAERRENKLKGLSEDKAAELEAKYEYHAWLADAARRVGQIQAVTHVLKATHPDARGSSLHKPPTSLPCHAEIGSHSLASYQDDIVGNAAALDVYKFLKIDVDGQRLLDCLQQNDADLLAALSDDPELAQTWAEAFSGLIRAPDQVQSHVLAKQLYWCVGGEPSENGGYHLLQPLFPSSLVHAVHSELNAARFGDENKVARQAYFAREEYTGTFQSYQNLAARKLGGTKPQNISQLNSERGGVNYLLSSAPPSWRSSEIGSLLGVTTVMNAFRCFGGVESLLRRLVKFLKNDPPSNDSTRAKVERYAQALAEALANFGQQVSAAKPAGWTANSECRLELFEKVWLDRARLTLIDNGATDDSDIAFKEAAGRLDWPDEVAGCFAQWLNGILRNADLPVGDAEFKHWARQALVDAEWPATFSRKAPESKNAEELSHV